MQLAAELQDQLQATTKTLRQEQATLAALDDESNAQISAQAQDATRQAEEANNAEARIKQTQLAINVAERSVHNPFCHLHQL